MAAAKEIRSEPRSSRKQYTRTRAYTCVKLTRAGERGGGEAIVTGIRGAAFFHGIYPTEDMPVTYAYYIQSRTAASDLILISFRFIFFFSSAFSIFYFFLFASRLKGPTGHAERRSSKFVDGAQTTQTVGKNT